MIKLIKLLKDLSISRVVSHNSLISIFCESPIKSSATPWQEIPEDGPANCPEIPSIPYFKITVTEWLKADDEARCMVSPGVQFPHSDMPLLMKCFVFCA